MSCLVYDLGYPWSKLLWVEFLTRGHLISLVAELLVGQRVRQVEHIRHVPIARNPGSA